MSSLSKSSSSEDDAHDHHHELRRGPWTLEEDTLLAHYIAHHGEGRWNLLAKRAGLNRTGKSCRLRWLNYLKPDVKRGNLTPHEQILILDLHSKLGNRWSKIAQHLPGRTDNEIKNYWRTRVQKQAKHLKVDANSTAFQEIVRCFWMPRLLQKIEGSTSSSSSSTILSHNSTVSHPVNNYVPDHNLPEQGSNSCISSTDQSMNISQISQLSEYQQTSPNNFHGMSNDANSDCYYVDNSTCCDMETENLETMSLSGGVGNCHMAEGDWVGCDFGDNYYMWSMDEFMAI